MATELDQTSLCEECEEPLSDLAIKVDDLLFCTIECAKEYYDDESVEEDSDDDDEKDYPDIPKKTEVIEEEED